MRAERARSLLSPEKRILTSNIQSATSVEAPITESPPLQTSAGTLLDEATISEPRKPNTHIQASPVQVDVLPVIPDKSEIEDISESTVKPEPELHSFPVPMDSNKTNTNTNIPLEPTEPLQESISPKSEKDSLNPTAVIDNSILHTQEREPDIEPEMAILTKKSAAQTNEIFKPVQPGVNSEEQIDEIIAKPKATEKIPEPPSTPTRPRASSVRSPSVRTRFVPPVSPSLKYTPSLAAKPSIIAGQLTPGSPRGSFLATRESQNFQSKTVPQTHINNPAVCAAVPSAGAAQGSFLASRAQGSPAPLRPSPVRGGFVQSAMLKRENSTLVLRSRAGSTTESPSNSPFSSPGNANLARFSRSASTSPRKGHGRTQSTNSINYSGYNTPNAFQRGPNDLEEQTKENSLTPLTLSRKFSKLSVATPEDTIQKSPSFNSLDLVEASPTPPSPIQEAAKNSRKPVMHNDVSDMARRLRELKELRELKLRQEREARNAERPKRVHAELKKEPLPTEVEFKSEAEAEHEPTSQEEGNGESNKDIAVIDECKGVASDAKQKPDAISERLSSEAPKEEYSGTSEVDKLESNAVSSLESSHETINLQPAAPLQRALPSTPKSEGITSVPSLPPPVDPHTSPRSTPTFQHDGLTPKNASVRRWSPVRSTWLESALNKKSQSVSTGNTPASPKTPNTPSFQRGRAPMPMPLSEFVKRSTPKSVNIRQVVGPKIEVESRGEEKEHNDVDLVRATPEELESTEVVVKEPVTQKPAAKKERTPPMDHDKAPIPMIKPRSNLLSPGRTSKRVPSPSTALLLSRASSLRPIPKKTASSTPTTEVFERLRSLRQGTQNRFVPSAENESELAHLKASLKQSSASRYIASDETKEIILGAKNSLRTAASLKNRSLNQGDEKLAPALPVESTTFNQNERSEPILESDENENKQVKVDSSEFIHKDPSENEIAQDAKSTELPVLEIEPLDTSAFEENVTEPAEIDPIVSTQCKQSTPLGVKATINIDSTTTPKRHSSTLPTLVPSDDMACEDTPTTDTDNEQHSPLGDDWSHSNSPLPSPPKFVDSPTALSPLRSLRENYDSCGSEDEDSVIIYTPPRSKPKPIRGGGASVPKMRGFNSGSHTTETESLEHLTGGDENTPPIV